MVSDVRTEEKIINSSYSSFYRTRLLCTLFKKISRRFSNGVYITLFSRLYSTPRIITTDTSSLERNTVSFKEKSPSGLRFIKNHCY